MSRHVSTQLIAAAALVLAPITDAAWPERMTGPAGTDWQRLVVLQSTDVTCGAAALASLLRFRLGIDIPESEITDQMLAGRPLDAIRARGGFSLLDLADFASARGLSSRGERGLDLAELKKRLPAIVPLNTADAPAHFVVVLWAEGDRFALADPATGGRWIAAPDLAPVWPGIAFIVTRP